MRSGGRARGTCHGREQIARVVAKPLQLLQKALLPIIILFEALTNMLTKISGHRQRPLLKEDEIKTFVSVAEEVSEVKDTEREMVHQRVYPGHGCAKVNAWQGEEAREQYMRPILFVPESKKLTRC
ncbi:MAG: CNNM domain-containing protein [bacterium]